MFCEAKRIVPTLEDIAATLRGWDLDAEVILVDDGSTDETRAVAGAAGERLFGADLSVSFVCLPRFPNCGKGAAVRAGLEASRGAWVLMMDADNSARLDQLPKLATATMGGHAGLVVGSRSVPDSEIEARLVRRLAGFGFRSAVRLMGMGFVTDSQCGFKLYRRDAARLCADYSAEDGFAFDLEHLGLCNKAGIGISEVGIVWTHSPNGTVNVVSDGLRMLRSCWKIRNRLRPLSICDTNSAAPDGSVVELKPLRFRPHPADPATITHDIYVSHPTH
jgi:dolichyl-phosphate beta-glucosyltransferase